MKQGVLRLVRSTVHATWGGFACYLYKILDCEIVSVLYLVHCVFETTYARV